MKKQKKDEETVYSWVTKVFFVKQNIYLKTQEHNLLIVQETKSSRNHTTLKIKLFPNLNADNNLHLDPIIM